ncbi:MAG: peptidoglycan DD-metalloendopeptidase family protein [Candidatus Harrisonbacteria bacterium]|nr:peptidoglycan DD-metalloendopeptidase family protein [Candidatus Harrisonbacteria bacterium]MBI2406243.1 peptidoglycan DD-metalloendopeptidase family protein [Candidatus Harrisonbacteria bacterium]
MKNTTVVIPVVFVFVTIAIHVAANGGSAGAFAVDRIITPATAALAPWSRAATLQGLGNALDAFTGVAVEAAAPPHTIPLSDEDDDPGAIIVEDSALLNSANPGSAVFLSRDGVLVYKVQKGDTLSSIAANFGITLNTVYWANKGAQGKTLRVGQEITILPVSGVIHQAQSGETLQSIASMYNVPESRIMRYNKRALARGVGVGTNLIIPDAKPQTGLSSATVVLPDLRGYFAIPTTGWNWGKLHNYNAVDIANACGTPIYAAAEGLVTAVAGVEWNEGYGSYVIIEHPNGTKTRYSHNERNVVSVGDYVAQGDIIGYIGNSGNTHGPTGCHLHFEVMGARNPFAK